MSLRKTSSRTDKIENIHRLFISDDGMLVAECIPQKSIVLTSSEDIAMLDNSTILKLYATHIEDNSKKVRNIEMKWSKIIKNIIFG